MLRRDAFHMPMLSQVLILLFCYFLAFSQVHPANYVQHAVYIFALISAILVFWITYDLTMRFEDVGSIVKMFLLLNIFVVIYCAIQMSQGPGTKVVLFGNESFSMIGMRTNNRLSGPFNAVGLTADYFVIMTFLILHELMHSRRKMYSRWLTILAGSNILLLLATANRTGFLLLVVGGVAYILMFRKELGPRRVIGLLSGGTIVLVLVSLVVVNYTPFGGIFDRLAGTTFEEGVPDTRQAVWPFVWKEIKRKPILGHGPRLRFDGGDKGARYKGHRYVRYPHNLYLFLTFTIGAIGLLAFMSFLATPLIRCWKTSLKSYEDPYIQGLVKAGVLILLIFFADQMKISFMRLSVVDYWHFIFALLGMFVGICDRAKDADFPTTPVVSANILI